ncbi:TerD family protein [Nocardia sp. NPDC057353]|uniref:TerD family protein n=1 Tax=Nocardia sp. NPDC057353 TaxID=3346104 RepID=UPI003633A941
MNSSPGTSLPKGGNVPLGGGQVRITVAPNGIDVSVLCVGADGKVGGDADFVFYNQPESPDGAVRLAGGAITVELPRVAPRIERLVVAASVDTGTVAAVPLAVQVADGAAVHDLAVGGLSTETTVVLGEIYRRGGAWKLRNVGQGYASGLAGLATDYGITVDDPGPAGGEATPPPPPAGGAPMPPPGGPSGFPAPPPAPAGYPAPPPAPAGYPAPPQGGPGGYPPPPQGGPGGFPPPPQGDPRGYPPQQQGGPAGFPAPPGGFPPPPPGAPGTFPPPGGAPPPPGPNLTKRSITLEKNSAPVLLRKAPVVRLRVAWTSGTDYEAYALVVLTDGTVVHVATFDAMGIPANPQFKDLVRHLGDRGRGDVNRGGGSTEEIIEVRFAPEIAAVVPVAYSAINNGTGSFHKYRVTLAIDSGGEEEVTIPADQAKKSSWIFTCVPGIVYNRPDGVLVERLELYSRRMSEHRPKAILHPDGRVEVKMDKGPLNTFKRDTT